MPKHPLPADLGVSAAWLRGVAAAIAALGVDAGKLYRHAELSPESLAADARLPIDAAVRLWRAGEALSGRADFGLAVGQRLGPEAFRLLGYLALSAANLREACAKLLRYQRLVSDGATWQWLAEGEDGWLIYRPRPGRLPFSRHQVEAIFAGLIGLLRRLAGENFAPACVRFAHAAKAPERAYGEWFRCPVQFDAKTCALRLPAAWLDRPLPQADAELARLHEAVAARALAILSLASLTARVDAHIEARLADGEPALARIAAALGLSGRSLQRRLAEEGTNFLECLDGCRRRLALAWVEDPALPLAEISRRLGFSEPTAFHRAYKRWTGRSPGAARGRLLQEGS